MFRVELIEKCRGGSPWAPFETSDGYDLLGHSSISVTGDIYGHATDDTARKAIDGLSGALGL